MPAPEIWTKSMKYYILIGKETVKNAKPLVTFSCKNNCPRISTQIFSSLSEALSPKNIHSFHFCICSLNNTGIQ